MSSYWLEHILKRSFIRPVSKSISPEVSIRGKLRFMFTTVVSKNFWKYFRVAKREILGPPGIHNKGLTYSPARAYLENSSSIHGAPYKRSELKKWKDKDVQ